MYTAPQTASTSTIARRALAQPWRILSHEKAQLIMWVALSHPSPNSSSTWAESVNSFQDNRWKAKFSRLSKISRTCPRSQEWYEATKECSIWAAAVRLTSSTAKGSLLARPSSRPWRCATKAMASNRKITNHVRNETDSFHIKFLSHLF